MVFSEAMRLYPPAWIMGRMAVADDEVGGYCIPAGSSVLVSQWCMHRHPAFWPQPERFDPERFNPDDPAVKERPRYAYFPFGGGPRLCIGEPFAWMEGVLVVATLVQRFRFNLAAQAQVEPQPSVTLRPRHGVSMILHAR
jgi:cytochrome P450